MNHPYADLIGLIVEEQRAGFSQCTLQVEEHHRNPHDVVHGAVMFALADTGMGVALYPTLAEDEICATIEVKINYFKPVASGLIRCVTELVSRGRTIANLDSRIFSGDTLIAQANGNYSIFMPRKNAGSVAR